MSFECIIGLVKVSNLSDNIKNATAIKPAINPAQRTMLTFNRIIIVGLIVALGPVFLACSGPQPEAPAINEEPTSAILRETPATISDPTPEEDEQAAATGTDPTLEAGLEELRLMDRALQPGEAFTQAVLGMGDSGNVGFVPVLVDLLRFKWYGEARSQLAAALVKLTGNSESTTVEPHHLQWDWWVVWLGENPQVEAVDGYAGWKGRLFEQTDEDMGALLYPHIPARIRLEEVVWGGVPKDGIPSLDNPPVLPADQAFYLNPNDRVFGVSFNGEHRAYPLRVMNPHEMANDVVGGVPFALAY